MMKLFTFLSLVLIVGCDEKHPIKEYKKITKEQSVCLQDSRKNINLEFVNATKATISLYDSKAGYIPLLIEQRRRMEKFCYVHASCYGDSEPAKSFEFEECLDGWVNKQQE